MIYDKLNWSEHINYIHSKWLKSLHPASCIRTAFDLYYILCLGFRSCCQCTNAHILYRFLEWRYEYFQMWLWTVIMLIHTVIVRCKIAWCFIVIAEIIRRIYRNDTKRIIMSNVYKKCQDPAISPPILWHTHAQLGTIHSPISALFNNSHVICGVIWTK